MNNSTLDDLLESLRDRPAITYIFTCIYAIGLITNALVIAVIVCRKNYRSSTYILIASMATSDAFCCSCLIVYAVTSVYLLYPNSFTLEGREFFCDFFGVTIYANYYISTHTLVIMSIDRYYAFVKPPFQALLHTKRRLWIAIVLSWLLGFLVVLPQIHTGGIDSRFPYICDAVNGHLIHSQIYFVCIVIFEEILPASIIIYCYAHVVKAIKSSSDTMRTASANSLNSNSLRTRHVAINKIIVITAVFLILTAIIHITRMIISLTDATVINLYIRNASTLASIINVFYGIAFLQPVVNPIIFCILNKSFRRAIFRSTKADQRANSHITLSNITAA